MFSLMPRRTRSERPLGLFGGHDLLPREFANLFERAFPVFPMFFENWEREWGMTVNEGENEVVVRAEMPGFEPAEINVSVAENVLTIRAEHREKTEKEGEEVPTRTVERTVTLPAGIATEKVDATYRNGILEIHFPRNPEAKPRRIEVRT